MKHLDLFSGIGGFAYALDQVATGGGTIEHIFCDNEPFARAVLHKHWPEAYIYEDIRFITNAGGQHGTPGRGKRAQRQKAKRSQPTEESERLTGIDIVTGGFPCQPFSAAGLRRGTADSRHLWPEMLRIIRLTTPEWVIAENVSGIVTWNEGLVFEQVCADLEAAGYEVQPIIVPAVAVNAPHRRDRVWFVAHALSGTNRRRARKDGSPKETERHEVGQPSQPSTVRDATHTGNPGLQGHEQPQASGEGTWPPRPAAEPSWDDDWPEVAAELCSVDDGLPARVDGLELTKSQHRSAQLKAYGNAIVPQVAMQIMEAIFS